MTDLTQCIRSLTRGRVRIRHEALKGLTDDTFAFLTQSILSVDGIIEAEVNPRVGSLLVRWDPEKLGDEDLMSSAEWLLEMLEAQNAADADESADAAAAPEASGKTCAKTCALLASDAACGAKKAFSSAGNAVLDVLAPVLAPTHARDKLARTRRVTQNRLMLGSLAGSLAVLAFKGGKSLHVGVGAAFLALLAVHLYQHRKVL